MLNGPLEKKNMLNDAPKSNYIRPPFLIFLINIHTTSAHSFARVTKIGVPT